MIRRREGPHAQPRRVAGRGAQRQSDGAAPLPVKDQRGLPQRRGGAPVRRLMQLRLVHHDLIGCLLMGSRTLSRVEAHDGGVLLLDMPHVGLVDLEVDVASSSVQDDRIGLNHLTLRACIVLMVEYK